MFEETKLIKNIKNHIFLKIYEKFLKIIFSIKRKIIRYGEIIKKCLIFLFYR